MSLLHDQLQQAQGQLNAHRDRLALLRLGAGVAVYQMDGPADAPAAKRLFLGFDVAALPARPSTSRRGRLSPLAV